MLYPFCCIIEILRGAEKGAVTLRKGDFFYPAGKNICGIKGIEGGKAGNPVSGAFTAAFLGCPSIKE